MIHIIINNIKEVALNYIVGDKTMSVTAGDAKWKNRILKWADEKPDEVIVTHVNNDGTIVATMPVKYFKLAPPRALSEEQKTAGAERLRAAREGKNTTRNQ